MFSEKSSVQLQELSDLGLILRMKCIFHIIRHDCRKAAAYRFVVQYIADSLNLLRCQLLLVLLTVVRRNRVKQAVIFPLPGLSDS